MKKIICAFLLLSLSLSLIACGSGSKQSLEDILLAGHSWGETKNESESIGMNYELFDMKATYTSTAIHNDDNEMGKMYYCFRAEDNDNFSKDKYYEIVDLFSEELGSPIEEKKSELTFNIWYKGSLKFVVEYRDVDEDIIYIDMINDKYIIEE